MFKESSNSWADLKIETLHNADIHMESKKLHDILSLLLSHSEKYPDIHKWFSNKVVPGIINLSRRVYIGYSNDHPVISAVLKKDKNAKFCHLHIDEDFRCNHLGELLFSIMALDVRNIACDLHFTLPESLWEEEKEFFKSFGFDNPIIATTQYRLFDQEYLLSAPYDVVWNNVLLKLPKLINQLSFFDDNIFNGVLVSIRPTYIDKIRNREKSVEVRRKFNTKLSGKKAVFYSSSPCQAICGHATIKEVIKSDPYYIWETFSNEISSSEKEYYDYVYGCEEVYAIILDDISFYRDEIYIEQLISLLKNNIKPPQSYLLLDNNPLWRTAVSIAELLYKRMSNVSI